MPVTVRPLEQADHAAWRRLWTAYLTFYETKVPEEVYASTWQRLFSGGEFEPRGWLALLDGRPVGLVHALMHRTCWSISNNCYLQDLFADPDVRAAFMLGADLALLLLRRPLTEALGFDPLSPDGVVRWAAEVTDITRYGVFPPEGVADPTDNPHREDE